MVSPERLYRLTAGLYNSALESIALHLGGAKKVTPDPPSADKDELQSTYSNFMTEANKLIDTKLPHAGLLPEVFLAAAFVPSIADIAKLVDSIFGIFKFFMNRRDEEKQFLIGRIDSVMWNQWADAGKSLPRKRGSHPKKRTLKSLSPSSFATVDRNDVRNG